MSLEETIRDNYQRVLERVAAAARSAGRDSQDVRLVVVTKGQPLHVARAAIAAGARTLGENYPEEGREKILALSDEDSVQWHMIGHIQSRKARLVAEHFNYVHSLDRLKIAIRLDRFAGELGCVLPVLLEFNVGGEDSKYGWPAADEACWPDLLPKVGEILKLANLEVRGLMTLPPLTEEPEQARPYFRRLRRLRDFLKQEFPQGHWEQLSMGMSADFEPAVQEGATMVRIGQAILGPRP